MPLNFRLFYDDRINNVDDVTEDVAAGVVTGPMYFEPTLLPGQRIPDPDYPSRPTGLAMRTFTGFLDTDGVLKTEAGGEEGVRLWANDPAWEVERLQYRVRADLTDLLGSPVRWHSFNFDAPTEDIVRDLTLEIPLPGQKFGRGRPGFGLAKDTGVDINGDGQLVLVREDGYELGAVTVPELSDTLDEAQGETIAYVMTFGR